MSRFIPVEPEKWAEMVKAQAENARLKAKVKQLTKLAKFAAIVRDGIDLPNQDPENHFVRVLVAKHFIEDYDEAAKDGKPQP